MLARFPVAKHVDDDSGRIREWDEIYYGCDFSDRVVFGVGIDESYGHPVSELAEGLERASQREEVMVLYGHSISDDAGQYRTSTNRLEELLISVSQLRLDFFTIAHLSSVRSCRE